MECQFWPQDGIKFNAKLYFCWITESIRKPKQAWKMKNMVKQKPPFALASRVKRQPFFGKLDSFGKFSIFLDSFPETIQNYPFWLKSYPKVWV